METLTLTLQEWAALNFDLTILSDATALALRVVQTGSSSALSDLELNDLRTLLDILGKKS